MSDKDKVCWAYGDWTVGDISTRDEIEWLKHEDKACAGALDIELLAEELGVAYTKKDLCDSNCLKKRLVDKQQKIELAKFMAEELGCPYSDKDLHYVHSFLHQLRGIKRANELAVAMGVGKIDFTLQKQSIKEYLKEQNDGSIAADLPVDSV